MKIAFKLIYALAIIVAFAACSSDDPKVILPQLTIDDVTSAEGSTFTFYVQINTESKDTVFFSYKTEDGTATSADYTAVATRKGKIVPGMLETQITVVTKKDALTTETDETFKVILSEPKNADILDGEGTGIITNVTSSTPPPTSDYFMKVKIDGTQWTGNVGSILGGGSFSGNSFFSYGTDNDSQISFVFGATPPTAKTYTIAAFGTTSANEVSVTYSPNFFSNSMNGEVYNGQTAGGELKITSYNTTTKIAEGTFKFAGKGKKNGTTKNFTDGSFKLKID